MAILYRTKCPKCGEFVESAGNCACAKCGQPITFDGMGFVQIYRKGSPVGIAMGYGIYLNGQPFGHLANKQSIRIALPFGTYTLHLTCGATRRCQDLTFTLTPQTPAAYVKGWIKMGVWSNTVIIEPAHPSEMPTE